MRQPGDRLGPYEIVAPIGTGAMSDVYRARDVRLQREVALKVLSGTAAAEPSFLARFEREARSASAIDHPNVVTVHDVGRVEATAWIALELVEGRTLGEVLEQGPLPVRRALGLAAQIADGLAAAHDRGVIHRDLKPANIKITPDGLVKVLDFGLAKITGTAADRLASMADDQCRTTDNALIGTIIYMSPEQAAGKTADYRSDQFALGIVLFEMLAGHTPFRRNTVAETLFAIIREETPPLPSVGHAAQVPLQWIFDRCLAKDPVARYASTRDLARDLHRLSEHLEHPVADEATRVAVAEARGRRRIWRYVLPALYAVAGAALGAWIGRDRVSRPLYEQLTFGRGHVVAARFVPDTDTVVYAAGWEGRPFSLYRKDPQGASSLEMDFPVGWLQAVSRKGNVLAVTSLRILLPGRPLGTLAEGPLTGGAARDLDERVQAADWDLAGNELAVVRELSGRTLLEFPQNHPIFATAGWISFPRISRSGKLVAFVLHELRGDDRGRVAVVDRDGHARALTKTFGSVRGLAWSPSGDEVWFGASPEDELRDVLAVPVSGGAVRLLARAPGPLVLLDVAPSGDALVARETRHLCISASLPDGTTKELSWLDSAVLGDLSNDGRTLLFTEFGQGGGGGYSTFLRSVDGTPPKLLGTGFAKSLSADGASALSVIPSYPPGLVLLHTGPGQPWVLNHPGLEVYHAASFVGDGRRILIAANEPDKGVRLYVQELGRGAPRAIADEEVSIDHFQGFPVSADGKWVAAVDAAGRMAVHAIDGGAKRPVAADLSPWTLPIRWTPDGGGLFVFRPDEVPARILRVDVNGKSPPRLVRTIAPPDVTGVHIFPALRLSADGRTCVYSYARLLTVLYRVKGLK